MLYPLTKTYVAAVLDRLPTLSTNGLTTCRKQADFARDRESLLSDDGIEMASRARVWMLPFAKRKTAYHRYSSYGLKHIAEPAIGYTTNGAFIIGAIAAGFDMHARPGDTNPSFNVDFRHFNPEVKQWFDEEILDKVIETPIVDSMGTHTTVGVSVRCDIEAEEAKLRSLRYTPRQARRQVLSTDRREYPLRIANLMGAVYAGGQVPAELAGNFMGVLS